MTVTTENAIIYKDVETYKPKTVQAIYNVDAIRQSIENILFTRKGELPFLRNFGSEIDRLLYNMISDQTAQKIYHFLIVALDVWEPRVIINNSRSNVVPDRNNNLYDVTLIYEIKGFEGTYYSITGSLRPST